MDKLIAFLGYDIVNLFDRRNNFYNTMPNDGLISETPIQHESEDGNVNEMNIDESTAKAICRKAGVLDFNNQCTVCEESVGSVSNANMPCLPTNVGDTFRKFCYKIKHIFGTTESLLEHKQKLQTIERRAMGSYYTKHANDIDNYPEWCQLKPMQKLIFYWSAISNEELCFEAFENFRNVYMFYIEHTTKSKKILTACAWSLWLHMSYKQRLPFIIEAIICNAVADGLNIHDNCEVKKAIKFYNKKEK